MAKESFQASNYIIKELGVGSFAVVYLSIPRKTADSVFAEYESEPTRRDKQQKIATKLRSVFQAGKIFKGTNKSVGPDSFSDEIKLLQWLKGYMHPNIATIQEESRVWYTMPVYAGGTLQDLQKAFWSSSLPNPPVAFVWHVALGMAEALLLLHHGVDTDGKKHGKWPLLYHNDMHSGNMLFTTSPTSGGYRDYPDIVLADWDTFLRRQIKDITDLVASIAFLSTKVEDDAFAKVLGKLGEVEKDERGAEKNRKARKALMSFIEVAWTNREEKYEPLSDVFVAYFSKPLVSDEDLERVFDLSSISRNGMERQ